MLKIFQARLQQNVNYELPDIQARFIKDRGSRDQISNICWIIKKAREFKKKKKKSTSTLLTMPKPVTVWISAKFGKFLNYENTKSPYLPPEKSECKSGRNS